MSMFLLATVTPIEANPEMMHVLLAYQHANVKIEMNRELSSILLLA